MRRLLPLALLFVVLAALGTYRESLRPGSEADPGSTYQPLAASRFTVDEVVSLEVAAPGSSAPAFTARRRGGAWVVDRPFQAPGSSAVIRRLVEAVATGEGELRTDDEAALPGFHLTPSTQIVLTLRSATAQLARMAVGRSSSGNGAFVRLLDRDGEEARAYATAANLRGLLGLAPTPAGEAQAAVPRADALHDRVLPYLDAAKAVRVEITAPGRRVAFERQDLTWVVTDGGPGLPVNDRTVDGLLRRMAGALTATGLVDPARIGKVGLDTPSHLVQVTLEDGTTHRVVGNTPQGPGTREFFLRRTERRDVDVVYQTSGPEFHRLFPRGADLFRFETLAVPDQGLGRIVIRSAAQTVELHREGGRPGARWELREPSLPLPSSRTTVPAVAAFLRNLRAVDWVDTSDLGRVEITIRFGGDQQALEAMRTIRIGGRAPGGQHRLATLADAPDRIVVLTDDTVARLAPPAVSLLESRIFDPIDPGDVTAVEIRPSADASAVRFSSGGPAGAWNVEPNRPTDLDHGAVTRAIARLLRTRVVAMSDGDDVGTGGLDVLVEGKRGMKRRFAIHVNPGAGGVLDVEGTRFRLDGSAAAVLDLLRLAGSGNE